MGNTAPARYTKQLGPMVTPEFAAELEADARAAGISISTLVRQMLEGAMAERRKARVTDAKWQGDYADALAKTTRQGVAHVTAHRDRDRAARGAAATVPTQTVKAAKSAQPRKRTAATK